MAHLTLRELAGIDPLVTVADADYVATDIDRLIVYTSLTAARSVTLPAPVAGAYRVVKIKDMSGAASRFPVTISISGGSLINGFPSVAVRTDYGAAELLTNGINYVLLNRVFNSGQIKVNTGNGLRPTVTWGGGGNPTAGTFVGITYAAPLGLSAYPTTLYPQNAINKDQSDVYDFVNNTFLENRVPGQPNYWRVIFNYSGKSSGATIGVDFRIRNLLSGFSHTNMVYLPDGRTSGQFVMMAVTIADAVSLPAPWGTGQGYVFDMAAFGNVSIQIDSIVRINPQVD